SSVSKYDQNFPTPSFPLSNFSLRFLVKKYAGLHIKKLIVFLVWHSLCSAKMKGVGKYINDYIFISAFLSEFEKKCRFVFRHWGGGKSDL
ncbi:MAG: hypothetical protein AABZ74_08115, partial [Cyanobacteriota bacterium]